jgi:hypothetical protein
VKLLLLLLMLLLLLAPLMPPLHAQEKGVAHLRLLLEKNETGEL